MKHFEKILSTEIVYKGKILELRHDRVELENGNEAMREVVRHNGGVAVLAIDADENALLVEQFRYPYSEVLLELPAGKLERGEDPGECGRRELEEETGHVAGEFRPLGKIYPTPGYVDEIIHLYVAEKLTATSQRLDVDEFLTVVKVPYGKAVEMCLNGEIKDAKTIVALLKYDALNR